MEREQPKLEIRQLVTAEPDWFQVWEETDGTLTAWPVAAWIVVRDHTNDGGRGPVDFITAFVPGEGNANDGFELSDDRKHVLTFAHGRDLAQYGFDSNGRRLPVSPTDAEAAA